MATGTLPEYPAPPGNKNKVIKTLSGPASYTQVSTGATPTGGQKVLAQDIGLIDIEFMTCGVSDDGQYLIHAIYPTNPPVAVPSVLLLWVVAATGAQVAGAVNLASRTFRLDAVGH